MNIDIHGHVVVREILHSDAHPQSWRPVISRAPNGWQMVHLDHIVDGPIPREITEWPKIIENLDAVHVDVMAVSPAPFLFFYDLDGPAGYDACRVQNDAIAQAVAQYPGRLVGLGIVPLQDIGLAVKELERIANRLKFPGIEVRTNVNGAYLGEEQLRPFWEAVQALDLFVFVHPNRPLIGQSELDDYYLINLIGNPIETTRSIADIVFSGVLEAYPRLKLCFAHAGGTVPYIRGRWEHGYHVRGEPKVRIERPPSDYLELLYFDCITHWVPALEFLVSTVGADRVLLGSDYPFDMSLADPVRFVKGASGLSEADRQKVLGRNAGHLLKL
jgi:aminocarboxymuconate-semialdehyde decarboxylase